MNTLWKKLLNLQNDLQGAVTEGQTLPTSC